VAPADAPVSAAEPTEAAPAPAPPPAPPPDVARQASAPAADGTFPRLAINNPFFEATPAKRK
jgi:hypothetical protein